MNHIELQKLLWQSIVKEGDTVIDCTCGNGHDTLTLAQLVQPQGHVIALDIQETALAKSQTLLKDYNNVTFLHQSHATLPQTQVPITLIVYNLGYLPGSNKQIITLPESTLQSLHQAIHLIKPQGAISIMAYDGHPGGQEELSQIHSLLQSLPSKQFRVSHTKWINYHNHPSLFFITKIKPQSRKER